MINLILGSDVPASASPEVVVRRVLPRAPPEVLQLERLLMTKQVKEQMLEPLPGQWWVEQSKEKLIKRPSSRRRRPLPSNNSSRKRKQRPRTSRGSTHLSEHSPRVWTFADTPLSENGPGSDERG
jgi:hypothetical protein